jgi:anti-anti-sigma factor
MIPQPLWFRGAAVPFRVRVEPTTSTARLVGELDLAGVPVLQDALCSLLARGPAALTIDFAGLTFLDAQGLDLMVWLALVQRARSAELSLVNVAPRFRRLFRMTGLEDSLLPPGFLPDTLFALATPA